MVAGRVKLRQTRAIDINALLSFRVDAFHGMIDVRLLRRFACVFLFQLYRASNASNPTQRRSTHHPRP